MSSSRDFESTGRFEPWFRRTFPDKALRIVAKFVITALVFAGLGLAGGFVLSKATAGAEAPAASRRMCDSDVGMACTFRVNARSFRHRELGRSRGYRAELDRIYRRPAVAKRVWIRKIKRAIEQQNDELAARGVAPRFAASDAAELYLQSTRRASCTSAGSYPAIASGGRTCNGYRVKKWNNGPGLTKRQVQIGGSAILCGTGVVLGLVAAGPSAGSVVYLLAGTGAISCLWASWSSVDPG
jgi:hypothetical protein